jgi:hypothetical protein
MREGCAKDAKGRENEESKAAFLKIIFSYFDILLRPSRNLRALRVRQLVLKP